MKFAMFDRQLGGFFGGIEGAVLGIVGTMFVVGIAPASLRADRLSQAGTIVGLVMETAGPVMPEEIRKVVVPFLGSRATPAAAVVVDHQSLKEGMQAGAAEFGAAYVGESWAVAFEGRDA